MNCFLSLELFLGGNCCKYGHKNVNIYLCVVCTYSVSVEQNPYSNNKHSFKNIKNHVPIAHGFGLKSVNVIDHCEMSSLFSVETK